MPPTIPQYDLAMLIMLNILITLAVLLAVAFFGWLTVRQIARSTREIMHEVGNIGAMTQNVAAMTREVLRRTE